MIQWFIITTITIIIIIIYYHHHHHHEWYWKCRIQYSVHQFSTIFNLLHDFYQIYAPLELKIFFLLLFFLLSFLLSQD